MDQTQITQCPKCDTTFRVTPAQLSVAKGAVRCGACLHVFRASDHFQTPKQPETSVQDDRTQDMFSEELFETPAEKSALIEDDNDFFIDDDHLIDDDNGLIQDNPQEDTSQQTPEFNEDFLSINADDAADPFFNDTEKTVDSAQEDDASEDESWAEALLDEKEEAKPTPQAPKKILSKAPTQSFSYIEVDPLDLSLPEERSLSRTWLWLSVCSLLLLTLTIQLAYFNFESWSRQESMRPWYKMACEQLDCTLPSTYDVSKIRTTASPQVSSHSKYQNALTVDILFMNHANYKQAFPKLELTFTDHNDKVIAHRLFNASEYLAGEAAGLSLMPIQTPIHIALEIKDPGAHANNYRVRFLAP